MEVKVLGPACGNCLRLEVLVMQVLAELGAQATVRLVTDPRELARHFVMQPPGLVVNGQLVWAGSVPPRAEIARWIQEAMRS